MVTLFLHRDKTYIRKRKLKEIDYAQLEKINEVFLQEKTAIDHTTWHDLDMNNIYAKINYTVTSPGEERLYSWLKNPIDNRDDFEKRKTYLRILKGKKELTGTLRKKLSKIKYYPHNFREVMGSAFFVNYYLLFLFIGLSLSNIGVLIYSGIVGNFDVLPIFLMVMAANVFIHFKFGAKCGTQLEAMSYLIKILTFSKGNAKLIDEMMPSLASKMKGLNKRLKGITKKGRVVFRLEGIDIIADYINVAFLMKEINFLLMSRLVNKYKSEIIELYLLVGELDASLSINRYRQELTYYSEPEIDEEHEAVHLVDMYHPLIDNPVTNSIDIDRSIAITGSNMSGKSTFLRCVGLNMLFAQSICTSLSRSYSGKFYRLITSISLNDDVLQGKSYFLSEAEAIKRMVELKDDNYPSLILIDEIFKGTNPIERLAAAMEILNTLSAANTKTLVATHDLQILPELNDYDYYYFTEHVTKEVLEFDYKIRQGVTTTRNAIKILEFIKYPDALIDRINVRIEQVEL